MILECREVRKQNYANLTISNGDVGIYFLDLVAFQHQTYFILKI